MATSAYTTFVGRDFTARLEAIMTAIRAELPELTDLNYSGIANVLTRLLASESDYLAFYQDEAYNETSIRYANFKQSILDAAATVDERATLATGATGYLTATKGQDFPVSSDLNIAKYTEFTRSDALPYLASEDTVFVVSQLSAQIPVIQGQLQTRTITKNDFELLGNTEYLAYNLGPMVANGTVTVTHTEDGTVTTTWEQVESFWSSLSIEYHFLLDLVADEVNGEADTVNLVIGNGIHGLNNFLGTMTVTYIKTAGADGNCGPGLVIDVPSTLTDKISVTNAGALTGGGTAEGTEALRDRIPAASRIQRRGLSLEDYEALIMSNVPSVKYCQAADRTTLTDWPHLYLALYIVPEGGGLISDILTSEMLVILQEKGHLGAWDGRYVIKDVTQIPVDVTVNIGIVPGYVSSSVVAQVILKIQACLSVDNQTINGTFNFAEMSTAVNLTPGVRYAVFSTPVTDIEAGIGEFFVLGTITVTAE